MSPHTEALTQFRRGSAAVTPELPALFVLEPAATATASVVNAWRPRATIQQFDATRPSGLDALRPALVHALDHLALRALVVCGEGSVRPDWSAAGEGLLALCHALGADPEVGRRLRRGAVRLEALYFDRVEGDVYHWSAKERRYALLTDGALAELFARIDSPGPS